MALYQISRLGRFYGYGVPVVVSVAIGLVTGHVLFFAARKIWRLPRRAAIPWGIGLAVTFFAVLPQIIFIWWPHSGRGYSLGIFTIVFLELSFRELMTPAKTEPPANVQQ
jgi:hypothetical protein